MKYHVQYLRGSLFWVASDVVGFFRREECDVCTSLDLVHRKLTPDRFTFYTFLAEAWIASAMIYACTTFSFVFSPWGIPQLQSDWSLSCDHGLDYAT